jgi:hypothetical protein
MMNFLNLENYLKVQDYHYRFTSFVNYWDSNTEFVSEGNYSIGYFCKNYPIYQKYDFSNWFFVNEQKDCLAEFAKKLGELDNTRHPTETAHEKFVEEIVLPIVQQIHM